MNIAVISGSPRPDRQSHQVAIAFVAQITEMGHTPILLDIQAFNLPILGTNPTAESIKYFGDKLTLADGLIIITPEHNGDMTGALKNTLDHYFAQYEQKPSCVIGVSAGMLGGILAVKKTQEYLVKMNAFLYPNFVITPFVQNLFVDNKLIDAKYRELIIKQLDGFITFTQVIRKGYSKK